MAQLWTEFRTFLTEHKLLWVGVMVLFFGLLVCLAYLQARQPSSPFTYRI